MTQEQVRRILVRDVQALSVDEELPGVGESGRSTRGEFIPDMRQNVEDEADQIIVNEKLQSAMDNALDPVERQVMKLMSGYVDGRAWSAREVGQKLIQDEVLHPQQERARDAGQEIRPISHTAALDIFKRARTKMQRALESQMGEMGPEGADLDLNEDSQGDPLNELIPKAVKYLDTIQRFVDEGQEGPDVGGE